MINTKNSNKDLEEIYEICEIFKITNDDDFWDSIGNLGQNTQSSYTPWGDFTFKADYETEEKFIEHYANPLAQLFFNRAIVCVTKENDKVSFKVFSYIVL